MMNRRSYLDTLNEGRSRRSQTSLDELNRTLERLEDQLKSARPGPVADSLEDRPSHPDREPRRPAPERGDGASMVVTELRALRDEMRTQMTGVLRQEFEGLRKEIVRSRSTVDGSDVDRQLAGELERLSDAIQQLADRGEDAELKSLRLEMDGLRTAMGKLAREETLLEFDGRWQDMDRRLDLIQAEQAPIMEALNERLEQIGDAIGRLPANVDTHSLDDRLRTLATAIDHFSRLSEQAYPGAMAAIEERLDEIARAIVATTTVPAQSSDEAMARVEARLASLGRQIDELIKESPAAQVIERLAELTERIEEVAGRANMPVELVERLSGQLAMLADRIETAPSAADARGIAEAIERQMGSFTSLVEQRHADAMSQARDLFSTLDGRVSEIVSRIEAVGGADHGALMEAIDSRLSAFEDRFEKAQALPPLPTEGMQAAIEACFADLTRRIEHQRPDMELLRSLETQLGGIAKQVAKPRATAGGNLDEIMPRLELLGELASDVKTLETMTRRSDERNGRTFEAIHDTLLKIVDRLAQMEPGVAAFAPEGTQVEDVPVEDAPPAPVARTVMPSEDTPSIDPAVMEALSEDEAPEEFELPTERGLRERSPAMAAAEAALAAVSDEPTAAVENTQTRRSLLGSVRRAIGGRGKKAAPAPQAEPALLPELEEPKLDLDAPLDPRIANEPLVPGSGAPDLNAIMKRVRDERGGSGQEGQADAARSDFIAAARRAAQAAAAEAEIVKRGRDSAKSTGSGFGIGRILRGKRKPVLMATTAILVAVAGAQLGKAFLGGGGDVASREVVTKTASIAPAKPKAEAKTASAAAKPSAEAAKKPSSDKPAKVSDKAKTEVSPEKPARTATAPVDADKAAAIARPARNASEAPVVAADAKPAKTEPAAEASVAKPATQQAIAATAATPAADAPATATAALSADAGPAPLRQAADTGDAAAMFEIASRHFEGRGVAKDMARAALWYEKAAEHGLAPAQFRIGNFYEKGVGVERDMAKAKTWYQLAATQGNASAMHNLAVLFAMGADGTTDNESATRWFLEAAEHGISDSQFNLGILAAKGVGMKQDLVESYKWFALVAKSGDADASEKRDEIAKSLSPADLEKARNTTELWKAKPLDPDANAVTVPDDWTSEEDRTAGIDMKQAIKTVQIILDKNGYEVGGVDGVMGQKTRAAIASFQGDNGMTPTGEVDAVLVKALLERK